jgi:hypothetical protein
MFIRSAALSSLSLVLSACVVVADDDDDGVDCPAGSKCDDPGEPDTCEAEGRYGDGTCDGTCALPDTDCFLFFADHAGADEWFTGFEAKLAASESRPPRALIAETDPRFVRMRELLDRGWASYAKQRPIGKLDRAPELVVIDDPSVNAFVAFDQEAGQISWTVMVQTGLIELDSSEPSILGVVMHELTHAVDRHVLPEAGDRFRIHYQVAPGEAEPLGFEQQDEPVARAAISAWRKLGGEAGPYPLAELNGVPTGGESLMTRVFNAVVQSAVAANEAGCAVAVERLAPLSAFLHDRISLLDGLLRPLDDAERAQLAQLSSDFLAALRDPCTAGSTLDLFPLIAELFGVTIDEVRAEFDPADEELIRGLPIVDQITVLTSDRYRRMREVEELLVADTGLDTSSLRYYSTEEAADDSTVPVLAGMGLAPDAVGDFFVAMLPADAQADCTAILGREEVPPYGDLVDEHHAFCWRTYHVSALADSDSDATSALARRAARPGAVAAYEQLAGPRLPRFRLPSDDTSSALHVR